MENLKRVKSKNDIVRLGCDKALSDKQQTIEFTSNKASVCIELRNHASYCFPC